MDEPPLLVDGQVLVPVRNIGGALQAGVARDNDTQTVKLIKRGKGSCEKKELKQ